MKKILFVFGILAMLVGCKKEEMSYYVDELVIDTEKCYAEGSFVQGSELNEYCKVYIPYDNGHGGTATISAPETNGMMIAETIVDIANGNGTAVVNVTGTPLSLENNFLQLNVDYNGKTYISSVEISVLEDMNPSGTVEFDISTDPIINLTAPVTLEFTVTPSMSAIVAGSVEGIRTSIVSDPETGKGVLTITPVNEFLSGVLEVTATFGARPAVTREISLNAFKAGGGTPESPYEISDAASMDKIRYGLDKYFTISEDISLDEGWTPVGDATSPFEGHIEALEHIITLNINHPDEDYVGLFGHIGENAEINGLKLAGTVTGNNYVAALAGSSNADITADASAVKVTGNNWVAENIASGDYKDEAVIEFGQLVTAINITMGSTEASGSLGVISKDGIEIIFDPMETNSQWQYDSATDKYTVKIDDSFKAGPISFYAQLDGNSNVKSTSHSIELMSKRMYESGNGTEGDPYIVTDADQFTSTVHTYPSAYIKLTQDITVDSWTSIEEWSGDLDGNENTISGLDNPFASSMTGSVHDIRFSDIEIAAGSGACGTVAATLSGSIRNTAVKGNITSSGASSGDTGLGGIAGQASGSAVIDNCYVNMTITTSSNFAAGGLVGVIKGSSGVTMSNSTVEGTITGSNAATKVGGILGRKTNASQNSTDIIRNCLVTATINFSATGSNMIGGMFGALQGATVSGNYVGGITIEECAFTGKVSGGNAIGGIGGVCCSARDCYVSGTVQATSVESSSTAAAAGISAAAKGDVTRCVVYGARITGQPKGSSYTAGIINVRNGNNPTTTKCAVMETQIESGGFAIYGTASSDITCSDNYRWHITYASNGADYTPVSGEDTYGQDGIEFSTVPSQSDFENLGYDFSNTWTWNGVTGAPELQKAGCDDSLIF